MGANTDFLEWHLKRVNLNCRYKKTPKIYIADSEFFITDKKGKLLCKYSSKKGKNQCASMIIRKES